MAGTVSRLYNFNTDYINGDPITDIKVDAELNQLIVALNAKMLCKTTAPSSPVDGQSWVDISESWPIAKIYDSTNSQWIGIIPQSLTTAERDALTSVPNGAIIFNETTGKLQGRESSAWANLI